MASLLAATCLSALVAAASAQEVPFVGVVVEDDVKARAGQGREYYVVGDVPRGTLVEVHEVVYGWYKISPPQGVHSYVSKGFVRARGDGTTGVVTGDNAWVRAAGVDRAPHLSYQKQLLLADGQTVGIVGERDDFYLIVPPQGAYVFVPPTALRRATPDEIAAAGASQDAASGPVAAVEVAPAPAAATPQPPPAEQPAPVAEAAPERTPEPVSQPMGQPEPETQTEPQASVAPAQPAPDPAEQTEQPTQPEEPQELQEPRDTQWPTVISPRMQAAEAAYKEVFDLPLEEQPIDSLRASYEVVAADATLPHSDRQIATARINQLNRNVQLIESLRQLARTREQLGQRSVDEVMGELRERQTQAEAQRPPYDAVGRLLASAVYDGASLPRLYRLVDPASGRTIAYVDPGAAPQAAGHLGAVVGIRGRARFDPALKLRLFDVERIEALTASE